MPLGLQVPTTLARAVALFAFSATTLSAQPGDTVHVDVRAGSRVWIEGSSNVHDWTCRARTFQARVDLAPGASPSPSSTLADIVQRVVVTVQVRDLECGNRKMERDLYHALKADDPSSPATILAVMTAIPGVSKQPATLETAGTLGVAGVERAVHVDIAMERLADGTVKARGSLPLLMTDFGVTPPTGLFGLIKSRNEVVVKFELIIMPPATMVVRR